MNLASIPVEQLNTGDPFVSHWTLDRIKNLQDRGENTDEIVRILFPETTLRSLLTTVDDDILLVRLIREMPEDLIVTHLPYLADAWTELPSLCAFPFASLLAKHIPDRAAKLFVSYIQGDSRLQDRMYAIVAAGNILPQKQHEIVSDAVMGLAFKNGRAPVFDPIMTPGLLRLAWSVDHLRSFDLLDIIAGSLPDEKTRDVDLAVLALVEMLTGESAPHELMTDYFEGYKIPRFAELAAFMPDSALGAELDTVVAELADHRHLPALEFYDRHKVGLPERLVTVLERLREQWRAIPDLADHDNTAALFALFPACVASVNWIGSPVIQIADVKAALAYIIIDLPEIELTDEIVAIFAALPPDVASAQLIEALETYHDRYGALRIVELMGKLKYPDFVLALLQHLSSDFDGLCEKITLALKGYGESIAEDIIDALNAKPEGRFHYLVDILVCIGGKSVTVYLENHFADLVKKDKETAMWLIEAVADSRFLERLAPLAGKGQEVIDETYLTLNKLHCISSDDLTALEKAYLSEQLEKTDLREHFEAGDLDASVPALLNMEMICSVCGDTSRYQVSDVYVTVSSPKPYVADELHCIACGAAESLAPTPLGAFAVTAEFMRITAIKDIEAARKALDHSPLNILPPLKAMNREMGIQEAIAYYRELIRKEPGRGEHHLGLGNIYRNVKQYRRAQSCYESAVRLNPKLIEGWYGLSWLAELEGDDRKGFLALQKGLDQLPDINWCHVKPAEKPEFINSYVSNYNNLK